VLLVEPAQPAEFEKANSILSKQEMVASIEAKSPLLRVTLKPGVEDYSTLATLLVEQRVAIRRFAQEEINLESAFMAFTKGAGSKI
jgi:ABC-2 type transport system ATP-binding protein